MYIFLTGGSGFIGKNFIYKAIKKGYKIFALSRKKIKNKKNLYWIKGNLDQDWSKYLKKSDFLVHLAAAGVNKKEITEKEALDANVYRPYKLLLNSINSGCNKWIIVGTASEYGKSALLKKTLNIKTREIPENNYEISKYLFTKLTLNLAKSHKIKCRIMRLFNVYGKGEERSRLWPSLNNALKLKKNFKMTTGNQIRDFIEVEHAVDILLDSLNFKKRNKSFPQIWHVASGNPKSVKNFAKSYWEEKKGKGKIFFGKLKLKNYKNYISDKKSIWKL